MPFTCIFQLNNGAISDTDEVIFDEYNLEVFDAYHENNVMIATAFINGKEVGIYSTCPCYISSVGSVLKGERLTSTSRVGYFSANGEDIPYNKPYAILKSD